ncbi:MAG: hypothetical protein IKJ39_06665 [Lachnospiraceae bacterium]|nr:hypothetical protein [Lachnospiraceae bacterium]
MKKFKELLLNNWGLKLISLTIAFALWFVVISVNDPVDQKSFANIKVNLINTELLTDKDKVYEVLEGTNQLRSVTFEAPKSIREKIEASDIIAEADFNDMTSTDTVPIKFYCPKYSNDVTEIEGNFSYVKLKVEKKVSKWIDIKYTQIGEVAEGYVISNISLDQNRLEITGPASKVAEVSKAVVDVNVSDISNDIYTRGSIQLCDANGNSLNYGSITGNVDKVNVKVGVYPTKAIPVEYNITGVPENGYVQTGEMETEIKTVMVAGPASLLNSTSAITIPENELDITGATGNVVKDINLRKLLPAGMIFADKTFDGKSEVTIFIEKQAEVELQVTRLNLQITNKPANKVIEYPEGSQIPPLKLRGLERYVSTVTEENLRGIVDVGAWMQEKQMEELSSGTYQIPVEFALVSKVEQMEPVYVTLEVMTPEEYADRARNQNAVN